MVAREHSETHVKTQYTQETRFLFLEICNAKSRLAVSWSIAFSKKILVISQITPVQKMQTRLNEIPACFTRLKKLAVETDLHPVKITKLTFYACVIMIGL